jgi:L-alanine-DL-glutamate epimerase-like enolase superfamily enzyme
VKIARIETYATPDVAVCRVLSDDGAEGWGQLSSYNADLSAQVLHRQVAPHALGRDPRDTEALTDRVLVREHKFPGSYLCRALGGLDTALWDLRGKLAGQSVCALLGGTPRPFPVYASSMRRDITPEAEAERLAELAGRQGHTAFKFRVGRENGFDRDDDEWPGRTEAIVPAVRRALGPDATLMVDGNGAYTPAKAIEVGRMLEDHGVVHFEEPCPYWELDWTARVRDKLRLDVAGGEQDVAWPVWRQMVERRVVDVVQPDILYLGGVTRTLRVARLAQAHGLRVVPHSANLSLVTLFSLHLMGGLANAGPYVEYSIEPDSYYPFQAGLFAPRLAVHDGRVQIPDRPGWGVEIDPDWLARADCTVSTA